MPPIISSNLLLDDEQSTFSKGERSQASKGKRVSFGPTSINSFETVPVGANYWHTGEQLNLIAHRDVMILRLMQSNTFVESDQHSCRGLEERVSLQTLKKRRRRVTEAVLYEQYRQRTDGRINPDRIALVSERATRETREIARVWGLRDADTVQKLSFMEKSRPEPFLLRPVPRSRIEQQTSSRILEERKTDFPERCEQERHSPHDVEKRPMSRRLDEILDMLGKWASCT